MSDLTPNLGLFKYNTTTDGKLTFNINAALNYNWDILDDVVNKCIPTTTVSGSTWSRIWTDGWKEQGGLVTMTETEVDWVQPTLSDNGTMGGNSFACDASGSQSGHPAWHALDGTISSTNYWQSVSTTSTPGYFYFYNPVPIKVTAIKLYTYQVSTGNYYLEGKVQACNDNSSWVDVSSNYHVDYLSGTVTVDTNGEFYNYYRLVCTKCNSPSQNTFIAEMEITAKQMSSAANSITFPTSFSNTNYSYCLSFEGGSGNGAYVSGKTVSGMSLYNTSAAVASWIAMGY